MLCVWMNPVGGSANGLEYCDVHQHHGLNTLRYETKEECMYRGYMFINQMIAPQMLELETPVTRSTPICTNLVNFGTLPEGSDADPQVDEPVEDIEVIPTPGARNEIEDCRDALYNCQDNRSDLLEKVAVIGEECGDADEDPDVPHDPTNDGTASNAIRPDDILVPRGQRAF